MVLGVTLSSADEEGELCVTTVIRDVIVTVIISVTSGFVMHKRQGVIPYKYVGRASFISYT